MRPQSQCVCCVLLTCKILFQMRKAIKLALPKKRLYMDVRPFYHLLPVFNGGKSTGNQRFHFAEPVDTCKHIVISFDILKMGEQF